MKAEIDRILDEIALLPRGTTRFYLSPERYEQLKRELLVSANPPGAPPVTHVPEPVQLIAPWGAFVTIFPRLAAVSVTGDDLAAMRVPKALWSARLSNICAPDARSAVSGYLRALDSMMKDGTGAYLWGSDGSGKTSAAVIVLKEARRRGFTSLFLTTDGLITAIVGREVFDGDQLVIERARDVDILVLDGLGREPEGAFQARAIENLVRERGSHQRVTVITTSLYLLDLRARYGDALMELVGEFTYPVCFGDPS